MNAPGLLVNSTCFVDLFDRTDREWHSARAEKRLEPLRLYRVLIADG